MTLRNTCRERASIETDVLPKWLGLKRKAGHWAGRGLFVGANACAWEALWRRMRRPIGPNLARHAPQLQSVSHPYCRRESPLSPILSLPFFFFSIGPFSSLSPSWLLLSRLFVTVSPPRCIPQLFHTIINASSLFLPMFNASIHGNAV
jgi:hypothetical protein